jgi:hypothetical protein
MIIEKATEYCHGVGCYSSFLNGKEGIFIEAFFDFS